MKDNKTPTKADLLKTLLLCETGATLLDICNATGWQAHSARAALTGLRKAGTVLERRSGKGESATTWRIVPTAELARSASGTSE
jgi:hypothetical protein